MAEDWFADVKKYHAGADEGVVKKITNYLGIALRNRDSSLVSFSDPTEVARVRERFLQKKLGLTDSDDVLNKALDAVKDMMSGDRTKNRVTVYYLLADWFGKLDLFGGSSSPAGSFSFGSAAAGAGAAAAAVGLTSAADAKPAAKAPAKPKAPAKAKAEPKPKAEPAAAPVAAAAVAAPAAAVSAAPAASTTSTPEPTAPAPAQSAYDGGSSDDGGSARSSGGGGGGGYDDGGDEGGGIPGWLKWLLAILAILLLLWLLKGCMMDKDAGAGAGDPAAVEEVEGAVVDGDTVLTDNAVVAAVPTGSGVVVGEAVGKPTLTVYFDVGQSAVHNTLAAQAETLKAYLAANPGAKLAVSGYNDPSGNAAANAELSKTRAQGVRDALIAAGVPEGSVELVKPADTTAGSVTPEQARRVEVTIQ